MSSEDGVAGVGMVGGEPAVVGGRLRGRGTGQFLRSSLSGFKGLVTCPCSPVTGIFCALFCALVVNGLDTGAFWVCLGTGSFFSPLVSSPANEDRTASQKDFDGFKVV